MEKLPVLQPITREQLEELIHSTIYTRQGRKTTICVFILKNKFEIVGTSACVNPSDFDEEIGRQAAYEDAFKKLWDYEAYHRQAQFADEVVLLRERQKIIEKYPESE